MNCALSALHRTNLKTKFYFHGEGDRPLLRHENGTLQKRSSRRNLKTPASPFSGDGKHFEYEAFLET